MATPSDKTTADHGSPARYAPQTPADAETPAERSLEGPPERPTYALAHDPDAEPSVDRKREPPGPASSRPAGAAPASDGPSTAKPAPRESRAARRARRLPRRTDRLVAWVAALLCAALAAVPLSVGLWQPDTLHPLEAEALSRSYETWHQQADLPVEPGSLERWVPVLDGELQLADPPGGTWLHLLTFSLLQSDLAGDDLLHHARLASVVLALLTVVAVFWAGMSIGGLLPATLAGLIAGSLPVLLFYGRLANDQFATAAMVTLAIAAAIWALRPLRPANHLLRQALGWGLCGLLLGLATLTGGLPATVAVLVPLVLIIILCPGRLGHVPGLVAAILLGGLVATPWALHVHSEDPEVWRTWAATLVPAGDMTWPAVLGLAGQRLGLVLLMALPWTVWLIAGLVQPFSTSSAGARTRLFIGWVWFISVLMLVLMMPGRGQVDELLMLLPPTALVAAQVIRQFRELAAEGRHPRIWTWLCWPHAFVLLAVSLAGPALMHFQPWLVAEGWLTQPIAAPMHPLYWAGISVSLVLLVALSLRFIVRRYPGKATVCWALWTMVAFSAVIYPATMGPLMQSRSIAVAYAETPAAGRRGLDAPQVGREKGASPARHLFNATLQSSEAGHAPTPRELAHHR